MIQILVIWTLIVCTLGDVSYDQLTEEIKNTKQLIKLYNQKLVLLQEKYNQHYPHIQYSWFENDTNQTSIYTEKTTRLSQKIILLKKLQYSTRYAPGGYLVNSNKILDVNTYEELGQFIGDVLVYQPQKLTTLVAGKVSITSIKKHQKGLIKDEYLTGQDAEQMKSIWHRNMNIKEAEDVLIQWDDQKIVFRNKQVKQLGLTEQEHILNVITHNQYKVLLVTNKRVAVINRMKQITESYYTKNFSRVTQTTPQIVCADLTQYLYVLLNTGQLVRLFNQKMVILQTILNSKQDFKLSEGSIYMQFIDLKLFIVHKKLGIIKIFNLMLGKYVLNANLYLPLDQPEQSQFQFYKINGSIRLIISTPEESNIYELLLPTPQDTSYTPSYLKVAGVLSVIACFMLFKLKKETNSEKDQHLGRHGVNRLNYSPQIEQFLKKQAKEQLLKHKKN